MRASQAVIKSHCDELEYFQRKLCLKDNGTNTEEILFLLRHLEQTQSDMKAAKDFSVALLPFICCGRIQRLHHSWKSMD